MVVDANPLVVIRRQSQQAIAVGQAVCRIEGAATDAFGLAGGLDEWVVGAGQIDQGKVEGGGTVRKTLHRKSVFDGKPWMQGVGFVVGLADRRAQAAQMPICGADKGKAAPP